MGTFDGFWAFELERRGATVVGIDIDHEQDLDWPPRGRPATFSPEPRGHRFTIAKELLGSKVERVGVSIYHARREDLGTFDFVFCGSVILHLRDQLLALERIAGLCTGQFISVEEYDKRNETRHDPNQCDVLAAERPHLAPDDLDRRVRPGHRARPPEALRARRYNLRQARRPPRPEVTHAPPVTCR